jgi:hypothetical protein
MVMLDWNRVKRSATLTLPHLPDSIANILFLNFADNYPALAHNHFRDQKTETGSRSVKLRFHKRVSAQVVALGGRTTAMEEK